MQENAELGELAGKIAEENKEGMQKLADEELSERRRNEFFVQKYVRKAKRFLGLESGGAAVINLN